MFEFLLQLSEINTLYAIYTGLILGLTLKYLWSYSTEYSTPTSLSIYYNEKRTNSPKIVLRKYRGHSNLLFNWIIQIVRRKDATNDETDSSVYTLYY